MEFGFLLILKSSQAGTNSGTSTSVGVHNDIDGVAQLVCRNSEAVKLNLSWEHAKFEKDQLPAPSKTGEPNI
jgi:hypothetical protein